MMTPKKKTTQAGAPAKRTPNAMAKAIHSKDAEIRKAVHAVLRKAGLHGVTVHSIHFAVAPEMMSAPACPGGCDPTTSQCLSVGGTMKCVPLDFP